jgi:hypothetical protein
MWIVYLIIHDDDYKRVTPSFVHGLKHFKKEVDAKKYLFNIIIEQFLNSWDADNFHDHELVEKYFCVKKVINEYRDKELFLKDEYINKFEIIEELYNYHCSECEYIDKRFEYFIEKIKF